MRASKRVAILQSNYIPWKGYFDIINIVDLFIFHDDLQYTKQDWRNRNKIKTPEGVKWLTIPCGTNHHRLICDVALEDHSWQQKHWNIIKNYYGKARYFKDYEGFFKSIYLEHIWINLSELNQYLIKNICKNILGIHTLFDDSRKYNLTTENQERVIELLQKVNASDYLSGPNAKSYLDEAAFKEAGINLIWMDYSDYPEYNQLYPPFEHQVSIIDLILNEGPNATQYLKSFQN